MIVLIQHFVCTITNRNNKMEARLGMKIRGKVYV